VEVGEKASDGRLLVVKCFETRILSGVSIFLSFPFAALDLGSVEGERKEMQRKIII